ncbi:MarR family winged helix-turn-helix transcriptional regulator [Pseudonocardia sulfidoxydans]|nr:MarR family transcriptional regulator [Pseudonocardia sulfidoxydans]
MPAALSESAAHAARDVRVLVGRLRRRLRQTYDNADLTPSQTSALSRIGRAGPLSASDLAAAERVRPQSIAATLAVLEERGLTERRPDPGDGRRRLLTLTPAGAALLDDGRRAGEEWLARALQEQLTEAERRTVVEAMALLDRVVAP